MPRSALIKGPHIRGYCLVPCASGTQHGGFRWPLILHPRVKVTSRWVGIEQITERDLLMPRHAREELKLSSDIAPLGC